MTSKNFQRFVNSFFGDPRAAWRDGLDLPALRELEPKERAQAEHMLLNKLDAGSRDPRIVRGLGELGSARAAAGLEALLPSPGEMERIQRWYPGFAPLVVHTAVALWRIERYTSALRYVTDVLAQLPHSFERMEAAIALRHFRCAEAVQALKRALHDQDKLVRNHVVKSLLAMHDLLPSEFESPPLAIKIMSDDASLRQEAVAELESFLKDAQISGA
jgi:HEAT repeat protein